jgi:hypothetical protein
MGGDRPGSDPPEHVPDRGVMLRPETHVLGEEAIVPDVNVLRPPPNHFTHEVTVDEPYRFDRPKESPEPDGVLRAGTRVLLVVDGPDRCRVADATGIYVEVSRGSLRELSA